MQTPDLLNRPVGDAGVRDAHAADSTSLGAIHHRSWLDAYREVFPPQVLAELDPADLGRQWHQAVVAPPGPGHQVLVAHHGPLVVGFAAFDPGGELLALHIDPQHQRRGHGSRLLAAVVARLQQSGLRVVHTWVVSDDAPRLAFLRSAGLGDDGTRRTFELPGGASLTESHLAADITQEG